MSEKTQRQRIVKALKELDAFSVENPTYPGTPDVNYVEGWIELKCMKRWPENADTSPVLVPHFTPQQRVWLRRRAKRKGNVFLLFQVAQEWLLFKGDVAADHFGKATRPELIKLACAYWSKGLKNEELVKCLKELKV
jgi:hypothetical protein